MLKRIITSVVALLIFLPFLIFSAEPAFVFVIPMALLALAAVYEIAKCTGVKNRPLFVVPFYVFAIAESVMARYITDNGKFFTYTALAVFLLIFISFALATFSKGKIHVLDASCAAMASVYVSLSFAFLIRLRDFSLGGVSVGAKIFVLSFLFAWVPDIGGYFAGRFFGKRKLIPDVSPKKTVEGLYGGILLSVVAALVYSLVISAKPMGYLVFAILGALCALVSVCGDLLASLIKRHYGIKDYGFIFPGHGGVMDRFDSVIAVAPVLYILVFALSEFGIFTSSLF